MTFPDWLKPLPGLMAIMAALPSYAEMLPLSEEALSELNAQSGLALSGSFDLNTAGGPLWDVERNPDGSVILENGEAKCSVNDGRCGARFTLQATEDGGWFVLDNLKGGIEFGESVPGGQPLEIRVEERDNNAGETKSVIAVKMSNVLRYSDLNFTVATADGPESTANQTNIYSLQIDGDVIGRGNILIFPTD